MSAVPIPTVVKPSTFTAEPVRIAYVMYTLTAGISSVLLISEVIDARVGGIITGIAALVYAAVSELLVRPAVTPQAVSAAKIEEALYTTPPEPAPPPATASPPAG